MTVWAFRIPKLKRNQNITHVFPPVAQTWGSSRKAERERRESFRCLMDEFTCMRASTELERPAWKEKGRNISRKKKESFRKAKLRRKGNRRKKEVLPSRSSRGELVVNLITSREWTKLRRSEESFSVFLERRKRRTKGDFLSSRVWCVCAFSSRVFAALLCVLTSVFFFSGVFRLNQIWRGT